MSKHQNTLSHHRPAYFGCSMMTHKQHLVSKEISGHVREASINILELHEFSKWETSREILARCMEQTKTLLCRCQMLSLFMTFMGSLLSLADGLE